MMEIHKRLYTLIYSNNLTLSERINQIIDELKNCSGSIVLNDNKRLVFISSSTIEDYLYHPSNNHNPLNGYNEAYAKRNKDIQTIQAVLNIFNDCISENDMVFFYENHILGISYRRIYQRHGYSRTKCTAANKRIFLKLQQKLASMSKINRSIYEI